MLGLINRVAFEIIGIQVYWYALIIVSGVVLAVWLASREAKKVGMREDDITDFMLWALPISIIGARVYYVVFEWQYYLKYPQEIFAIRNGGLAIYGGLIAGGLVLFFFSRHRFISVWKFLDVAAPSVIIAQAIGRWGNFMNHEAYGPVTTRSFLENLHLPKFIINNMDIEGAYRQPTFLYESLWNVIGFMLLLFLRSKRNFLKEGEVFLLYIGWYSFGRFFIEGLRTDSLMIFGTFRVSQLLSAGLFIGSIILFFIRRRKTTIPFYLREGQSKA